MKKTAFILSATLMSFLLAGESVCLMAESKVDRNSNDFIRTNGPRVLEAFKPVVATPSQSVVQVLCNGKKTALGTIVSTDGFIVSKHSEIKLPIVCELRDGRQLEAQIVGVHEPYDLVLLKVEAKNLKPIRWADSKKVEVGNWVATPGTSLDPVAVGVISVGARKVSARDLPPVRGDSGFLGIALETAEGAARVISVEPKSPADKVGLLPGDLINRLAGKEIKSSEGLIETVQRFKAGETVEIKVKRKDENLEFKCVLGRRPIDRAAEQNSMGNENSIRRGGFPTILQHDTVLKPVDCGGPLVDLDGEAVGINIARAGRTETYAVPVNDVLALLPDLKSGRLLPEDLKKQYSQKNQIKTLQAELEKAQANLKNLIQKSQETRDQEAGDLKAAVKKVQSLRNQLDKAELDAAGK